MKKICRVCGCEFKYSQPRAQYCSVECRKNGIAMMTDNAKFGRPSIGVNMVGAMEELKVCAKLLEEGYLVFRNVAPCGYADLIALKDGEVKILDVKAPVRRTDGSVVPTASGKTEGVEVVVLNPLTGRLDYFLPLS